MFGSANAGNTTTAMNQSYGNLVVTGQGVLTESGSQGGTSSLFSSSAYGPAASSASGQATQGGFGSAGASFRVFGLTY